jgi:hypothetical protein
MPTREAAETLGPSAELAELTVEIDGKMRPTTNNRGELIASTMERVRDFWRWFGESVVVDQQGRPLVVYRGEHGTGDCRDGFHSRRGSMSFGSLEAAKWYAQNPNDRRLDASAQAPRVLAAYLRLLQPAIDQPGDPFLEIGRLDQILGRCFAMEAVTEFSRYITNTSNWLDNFKAMGEPACIAGEYPDWAAELYFEAYALLDSAKWVGRLRAAGFDGAIHCGSGETAGEPEFKVFSQQQARRVIAI